MNTFLELEKKIDMNVVNYIRTIMAKTVAKSIKEG